MERLKQRNKCLDAFKGIACILVVFLHVRLPFETLDGVIQSAARFAIPLFFMVSGYYCYYSDNEVIKKKLPGKIMHIFRIAVTSFAYWFVMHCFLALFGQGEYTFSEIFKELIDPTVIVDFLLFNADPLINILWFIFALLYVYILFYIFVKINKIYILIYLIPLLLTAHFMMGNIAYSFGITLKTELFRNCWLMGLPLFMIGYVTRKNNLKSIINSNAARNLIIVGLTLSVIEWLIIGGRQQMYIGSILAAIAMIIYSEHNPAKVFFRGLYVLGNKYSLFIYIVHISIGIVLDRIAKEINLIDNIVYLTAKPVLVIFGSIIFAMMFYSATDFIKSRKDRIKT